MIRISTPMLAGVLLVAASLATGIASAQTVQVVSGAANNVTTFNTINAALSSFNAAGPGVNSGNTGQPNIVEVTFFGPFDEALTHLGNPSPIGALPGPGITDGGESFTVRAATGVTPLVLLQGAVNYDAGAGTDGWVVTGGTTLNLEGLVFAASPNATPGDDLFSPLNDNSKIIFTNCILTAFDGSSTTFTTAADMPADLLDGTRAFDFSVIRSGDNGFFIGGASSTLSTLAEVTFNSTLMTQQGAGASPDGLVGSTNSLITLNAGSVLANNNRYAVQTAANTGINGANITIAGTAMNPVIIRDHPTGQAIGDFIVKADINYLIVDNCRSLSSTGDGVIEFRTSATRTDSTISIRNTVIRNIGGAGSGLFLFKNTGAGFATYTLDNNDFVNIPRFGIYSFGDQEAVSLISNSRFLNCVGGGIANLADSVPTMVIDRCSFVNSPLVFGINTDTSIQPVQITNTIIAQASGVGITAASKGAGNIDVSHSDLPTAGPNALALQDDGSGLVVYGTGVLADDPEFLTGFDVFGDPNYMDVEACALKTASSTSGPLAGGGTWIDPGTCVVVTLDGDANNDGVIDVADVTLIYNVLGGVIAGPVPGDGDVDEDTDVDAADAAAITAFLVNGTPIP